MKARISFIFIFILYNVAVFSQEDLTVQTKISNDTIGFFDVLIVHFEANNFEVEFKTPTFKDFEIYKPLELSVSVSYQSDLKISNKIYTYYLKPKRSGKLILESVTFYNNEKSFETKPMIIQVNGSTLVNNPLKDENKIFCVAHISNYNPYCYQPVTIDYKLYFDDDIVPKVLLADFDALYLKEFLIQTIDIKADINKELYNGKEYNCALIKKDVIRFKKLYDIYINNKIVITYKTNSLSYTNIGFDNTSKIILPVVSERIISKRFEYDYKFPFNITSYGDYKLEVLYPQETKIKKDKIIEISLQLYGEGYIDDNTIPLITIPGTFEIISNTIKNDHVVEKDKIKSVASRTYKLKPLSEGNYTFYPAQYNFYNESSNEKKAIYSKEFKLSVR
jgi:hypothetical protein